MALRTRGIWLLLGALGFSSGSVGCARIERAKECHQLAVMVNASLDQIDELAKHSSTGEDAGTESDPLSAEQYRKIARLYLDLSKQLAAYEVDDKKLAAHLRQYEQIAKRAAAAAERLATAHETRQPLAVRAATSELQKLQERHRSVSVQIDQLCIGP